ncbi:MAG TPA: NAD(P)H-binding protein [Candidatus Dormibacteraeota bacterium]|nr:NAD(P)H-binding protein [Candidatus Dormibacteraeota bacterium]
MNVLVTGGTGTVGRHVVMQLRQKGHRARIFSRHPRGHVDAVPGDLKTGTNLDRALNGMDAIVHAATEARQSLRSRGDVAGTKNLVKAAQRAHTKHLVYISIVGIDDIPTYPYYRTKRAVEKLIKEAEVPWSILRATQFHDLMEVLLRGASRVPGITAIPFAWQYQPVEAREVAARLVEVVLGEPQGMLEDFGGPEVRTFRSIGEAWLAARKERRRLVNMSIPFKFSKQMADGKLLAPGHTQGKVTFDQYLAERYPLS